MRRTAHAIYYGSAAKAEYPYPAQREVFARIVEKQDSLTMMSYIMASGDFGDVADTTIVAPFNDADAAVRLLEAVAVALPWAFLQCTLPVAQIVVHPVLSSPAR